MADGTGINPLGKTKPDGTHPRSGQTRPAVAQPGPIRRWIEDHPAAGRTLDVLRTLAWVVPLTLLIWIYAERAQSTTITGVTFPIEVKISSQSKVVSVLKPSDKNVVAELSGPRHKLDRLRELLAYPRRHGGGENLHQPSEQQGHPGTGRRPRAEQPADLPRRRHRGTTSSPTS